jgi:thymidylate synthase
MQKIVVFQQKGSGISKIEGIREFGQGCFDIETINIDDTLPPVLDDTSEYLPENIEADLVLDFLKHRDLSEDLSLLCERLNIPDIASGKKLTKGRAVCPPT